MRFVCAPVWATVLVLLANPAMAEVSTQEAAKLGSSLTPYGAEKAGNAAGTIPAWEGGITAPPPGVGYTPGEHHPDPFAADKVLYTVTPANLTQYDAIVTDGHKGMFAAYPDTYKMNVYPTHRSCAYPQNVYDAVKRNAVNAKMTNDGNGITGATMGPPFPVPQSAREIIWNHELNFRGFKTTRGAAGGAPTKGGDFTLETSLDHNMYLYSDPALASTEALENKVYYLIRNTVTPPSLAGSVFMLHYTLDQVVEDRHTWNYKPGERKVKRVTGLKYDTPTNGSDGIRTVDNFQLFSGGGDRYDWELTGKQEMLIPYNAYRLASPENQYKDILQNGHLNQDLIRYELHRTWVVEGKLKAGKEHRLVKRRMFYFDEDTWILVSTALYGHDDKLTRVQEGYVFNYYEAPACLAATDVIYDVNGGVYHILGLRNQEQELTFDTKIDRDTFTTENMRRIGMR